MCQLYHTMLKRNSYVLRTKLGSQTRSNICVTSSYIFNHSSRSQTSITITRLCSCDQFSFVAWAIYPGKFLFFYIISFFNSISIFNPFVQISIRLPISDLNAYNKDTATWEMWDALRSLCGYNARLDLGNCA